MFDVVIGRRRGNGIASFTVVIEGCPRNGIEAIDFRRAHGLPEAPACEIDLPGYSFPDEVFVREHPDKADGNADILTEHRAGEQVRSGIGHRGEIHETTHRIYDYRGFHVRLSPEAVRAYLEAQTPKTGRALLLDLWDGTRRSLEAVQAELLARREAEAEQDRKLQDARGLLADELAALKSRAEKAEKEADYWRQEAEKDADAVADEVE
jgi:hypothetical protein